MNRGVQFAIFFAVIFAVYFLMNYYVVGRLSSMLFGRKNFYVVGLIILLTLSFIVSNVLVRYFNNSFVHYFYRFSSIWLGILFLLLVTLGTFELVNHYHKLNLFNSAIIIISLVLLVSVGSIIHARKIEIRDVEIPLSNIDEELIIVQLSDIHIGAVHGEDLMKRIVRETNKLNPDIVVITGDWFDGSEHFDDEVFKHVDGIKAPVYFITGNHEFYEGFDEVDRILSKTKTITLKNESVKVNGIQLIGSQYSESKKEFNDFINNLKLNKSIPSILLKHVPNNLQPAFDKNIDLVLSGHMHGGQVFPFNLLEMIFFKYIKGLYGQGSTNIYVSQGTGDWGPPMRLGTTAEITKIRLIKK